MASGGKGRGKYSYGFDEFLQKLDAIERNAPGRIAEELNKEGKQIIRAYRKRVRTEADIGKGKKHLHNGMDLIPAKRISTGWEAAVANNYLKAPHFHLVEHGHELILGRLSRTRAGTVGGKKYFKRSVEAEEPRLRRQRFRWAYKAFEELK